jgi:cyclohexa-1,5-dienecarbonyl-CoA hydratase
MTTVFLEKFNSFARVTLNKPPLNVMDIAMMEELNAALKSLKDDRATKVIVVAAAGKAFSAGVDVADHTADRVDAMIKKFHAIFHTLWSLEQPIVAAVQGMALGGGCELAIACDFIIASEKAKLGQPEIKVGVFPPIAALLLPRLIGRKKAYELLLIGETIDAREAERIGLVNRVSPPESFDAAVNAFVGKLTALSGVVLQHTKQAVRISLDAGIDAALADIERYYLNELMRTEDALEGLNAFMEKRSPVWKEG